MPTEQEIRAMGFEPEDYADDEPVEVWPENWTAFCIFADLATQWVPSMAGFVGLNYPSLYPLLDRAASTREEWDELFADVQVMERAARPLLNKSD